ncbi:MAG TPA: non-heme iron oxygenase ferredoxin subunit [Aliidongia sp.]|uniref:non-heme iron oxygenase ferredoxin subunit n=1 Tax=Aliidongia sp. TaxID=1914230 RepID=UPI002DDCAEFC|nr:non-heme iron oxygenase ferredoxin subunit [Aliidongia sp.]HEV2676903.1 non-heme iron oxygenase ferredoxin subunit [Aliidongia sp.]
MTARWIKVATTNAIDEDDMIAVEIEGRHIAIYHVGGVFHATANVCTHAYALLTDGFLDECTIECPLHAGRFDITTGKALGAPVTQDLKVYALRVEGTDILIALD